MIEKRSYLCLSHFVLKIIAVVLMTIDHITYFFINANSPVYLALRIIGRAAFPIFVFLSVQGVRKSHNPFKYALRLLVLGYIIDGFTVIFAPQEYIGNTLVALGLGVLTCSLIEKKNKFSFLAIFPFALAVLSDFDFFPIKTEYGTFGQLMFLSFYLVQILVDEHLKDLAKRQNVELDSLTSLYQRKYYNIFSALALLLLNAVTYLIFRFNPSFPLLPINVGISQWSLLGGIFIIFYSGKRGYNNRYLNDAFYFYYPLHILILALIAHFI